MPTPRAGSADKEEHHVTEIDLAGVHTRLSFFIYFSEPVRKTF
jgi:hypothetical protein